MAALHPSPSFNKSIDPRADSPATDKTPSTPSTASPTNPHFNIPLLNKHKRDRPTGKQSPTHDAEIEPPSPTEEGEEGFHISPEANQRVLRKIDKVLIPLMTAAYTLQYIDKSAMSYAAVFTFRQDCNLTPHQYQWLGSCYYFGYLAFSLPNAYLLQRLRLNRYLGCCILIWGLCMVCMAVPRYFAGLAVLRTLLGMSEGTVTPGFVLITSRFYKREEQPLRVGIWYCCNGLGSFIGGLISYGTGHIDAGETIPNWIWIFIINGTITVIVGVCFLWYAPEQAENAWFLSEGERIIAKERVRGNMSSLSADEWKWSSMFEGLLPWKDPQGWLLFILVISYCIPNGGIGNFLHLILQSYGFSAIETILLGLPQSACQVIFTLGGSYMARNYKGWRTWVMIIYVLPAVAGVAIQYGTRNTGALLFGYYMIPSFVAGLGQAFAMPGANVTGYTKRCTTAAMVFVAYAVGNIIGPHLFDSTEKPPYRSGMLACIICFGASIPIALVIRYYYTSQNAKRDKIKPHDPTIGNFEDLTDLQNQNFRYAL